MTFVAPASGASGTFAGGSDTAVTSSTGTAMSAAFTANSTSGSYTVTASAPGVTGTASFSLTNQAASIATTTTITFDQLQLSQLSTARARCVGGWPTRSRELHSCANIGKRGAHRHGRGQGRFRRYLHDDDFEQRCGNVFLYRRFRSLELGPRASRQPTLRSQTAGFSRALRIRSPKALWKFLRPVPPSVITVTVKSGITTTTSLTVCLAGN